MREIINLQKDILTLFRCLAQIEIDGEKGNYIYNEFLNDLRIKMQKEDILCNSININEIPMEKVALYLKEAEQINEYLSIRFFSKLVRNIIKKVNQPYDKKDLDFIEKQDKIIKEIQINRDMLLIMFLREEIEKEKDDTNKEPMIRGLYDLCFLHPLLGTRLLDNAFEIDDEYYLSCYFVSDVLSCDRLETQKLIDKICSETLYQQAMLILEDEVSWDEQPFMASKFAISNIRASKILISDDELRLLKKIIDNKVRNENLENQPNYELLMDLLSEKKKGLERIRTVTFKKSL